MGMAVVMAQAMAEAVITENQHHGQNSFLYMNCCV